MTLESGVNSVAATMADAQNPPVSEASLILRAKEGDQDAFETLYRQHVGRVYALCLRMTADVTEAEDLTQDVFIRTWNKIASFRGESAFSTWLHRLTVNLVLTNRRSHARRTARVFTTDDLTPFEQGGRTATAGLAADLERAIAKLPKGARQVFVLHDVEGYRHDEIAERMGLAVGTSKAQLHRARALLRKALA